MKKMKRIWSILLVLGLVLVLWSPARAAEGEAVKLTMAADQRNLMVGKTVTVTIGADRDFSTRGSGMTIYYDGEALQPDLEASAAASPLQIHALTVGGKEALRISFLPGLEPAAFSSEEPLARIPFKALAPAEETAISVEAAYLYDEQLTEISLDRPEAVALTVEAPEIQVPVTGITLDQRELTLEEGEMGALKATIEPADASDTAVIWTSSDETVAVVSDGVVKALNAGTAAITAATRDGGFTAACAVTVKAPEAGYTVKMPADTTAAMGGRVQIPVAISNEDGKTGYNAFDIDFAYDLTALELTSTTIPGVTVNAENGRVNVLGYGEARDAGSVAFTLEFRVLKTGTTEVRVTSARVDNSGNAVTKNTSLAALTDDRTAITAAGYPVTLPDGFSGGNTAAPGTDYTFAAPDDYYDYTVTATVGGKKVTLTKNSDGSYTIPGLQVTGEIVITATRTGKNFQVTLGTDMTGSTTARYGTAYEAVLNRDEDYEYAVTVTVGGKEYSGYGVEEDTYTIPGTDVTGEIVFTVVKTMINDPTEPSDPTTPTTKPSGSSGSSGSTSRPSQAVTKHTVTFTGSGAGAAQGNAASIANGKTYTLTLKKQTGYKYQVSYKMGANAVVTMEANEKGKYTIPNVTGPLQIIIEKSLDMEVTVTEFVTLDEKSVFLILAEGTLAQGDVLTYNGTPMYESESYGGWAYLVIADRELNTEQVYGQLSISTQTKRTLEAPNGDVDENGQVNRTDAQLVREIYNAKYRDFSSVKMEQFLRADVNGDQRVDLRDMAWVLWEILESEVGKA